MEEEQSDVGSGGSELRSTGELPCEVVRDSMGGENQVEESYEEGDGGEIMVEIVGSDVFFNGQIGDLEGHDFSEDMDISAENEMGECRVGFVESKADGGLGEVDRVNSVKSELSGSPVEAAVEGNVRSSEKEEIFPSTGNDAALDCGLEAKIVDEKEVFAAECRETVVKMEAVVSDVQDEDHMKFGRTHGTDGGSHASPVLQHYGDAIADVSKAEGVDIKIEDAETNRNYDGGTEEHACETDELKLSNKETVKSASLVRKYLPGYLSPPENEGHFGQSDLVWGKVQNHPWWPGQIFDHADASEKALKCYRKDSYLVAYFGDQTFAWNDSSAMRPFRSHFSEIEKQSNSGAFKNAVNSSLEEVSRRVELGLACSCIQKDAYIKIGTQVIENAGIREESSRRCGVYHTTRATLFEPYKLLEYISNLAPCASFWADRLDLVIARAQLSAFYRFKGYRLELLENNAYTQQASDKTVASRIKGHTPMEVSHPKERSLTDLMAEREHSESVAEDIGKSVSLNFERKRKALDPLSNRSDKRTNTHFAIFSSSMSHTPKPLLKIGTCISRVASQFMGYTSLVKGSNDEMVIDGSAKTYEHYEKQSVAVSVESVSVNEMLSQLQLVAKDPKKRPNIQNSVHAFFLGFRNSIVLNRRDRKGKAEPTIGEEFDFDDANDTYWKQRTVQNHPGEQLRIVHSYSGEQLRQEWENRTANFQPVQLGAEKSVKTGHKSRSRKRFSTGNYPMATTEPDDSVKRRKRESSPAELILNFAERKCVPSEINLNKIFRRFGSLMESETEVDHDSGCAKVIFKRGSDAEVALSSAEKFNIFGPVLVKYQIGYSPLISVKVLPLEVPQFPEDETLML